MNKNELKNKIVSVFGKSSFSLSADEIVSHQCEECDLVKSNLKNTEHLQLPDYLIKEHSLDLPLLTPKALRYFFPNYLMYALENPDSLVCEFMIYHIKEPVWRNSTESRFHLFNPDELEVVRDFIRYLRDSEIYHEFTEEIDQSMMVWNIS